MSASSKTNVLIYDGPGISSSCLLHLKASLKTLLSPSYDVLQIGPQALINDSWTDNCALIAFPGGRDLGYLESLGSKGCARIASWVRDQGGRYLGLCAGAYFASDSIDFESGRTGFEVKGDRPLKFFDGVCKGTAFPGFVYDSEDGARDASIVLEGSIWNQVWSSFPETVSVYYNGGGYFQLKHDSGTSTTVIARYSELEDKSPAGLLCHVGNEGKAVLWGVHPEHPSVMPADASSNGTEPRLLLLKASLKLLDLKVPDAPRPVYGITPHLLVSEDPADAAVIANSVIVAFNTTTSQEGISLLADVHNNIRLNPQATLQQVYKHAAHDNDANIEVIICSLGFPSQQTAPLFNFTSYFSRLKAARDCLRFPYKPTFGSDMLYGEVVTSTQTVLEKNPRFQSALPSGFTFMGSHQTAGRGRGSNNWLSPPGCLQFSILLRARKELGPRLVFLQYLFGLSVVEAVCSLPGYENLPLHLKWPNDLYVDFGPDSGLKKIGGILVNSTYAGGDFTIVIGCGINTTNSSATAALCDIIQHYNVTHQTSLDIITQETLLANILPRFEYYWTIFDQKNDFSPFNELYNSRWLHSGKEVTIEETGQRVKILGLAPDTGCLRTRPLNSTESATAFIDLQPNGNSFDMMQGLLKVKR